MKRKKDKGARLIAVRVRMTESERKQLADLADKETGGNMSELIRRRLFRESRDSADALGV